MDQPSVLKKNPEKPAIGQIQRNCGENHPE